MVLDPRLVGTAAAPHQQQTYPTVAAPTYPPSGQAAVQPATAPLPDLFALISSGALGSALGGGAAKAQETSDAGIITSRGGLQGLVAGAASKGRPQTTQLTSDIIKVLITRINEC